MERHQRIASFTLIELLIVIGILAILTAAVVLILNPGELLKESRDSKRMTDVASISHAIQLLLSQAPSVNLGAASTVYISLPDTSVTCANLGLPALPSGYSYHCVTAANETLANGNGWIPIDFTQSPIQNIAALPVDGTNASSSYLYYTYMTDGTSMWKISATAESAKYLTRSNNDGGDENGVFEAGNNMSLLPADGTSCAAIKAVNSSSIDGTYWIKPDQYPAAHVYCDMTTDGGGWTLVLNDTTYIPKPAPAWEQAVGSNTITGTFGITLTSFDQLLGVGYWNDIGTQVRLQQGNDPTSLSHSATYTFSLDANNNYTLHMSNEAILLNATGTASPGMYTYSNGRPLTTYDRDNDQNSGNCASVYGNTPWWYGSCWSGSFWGYNSRPYWTGSGSENFLWGGIWIK